MNMWHVAGGKDCYEWPWKFHISSLPICGMMHVQRTMVMNIGRPHVFFDYPIMFLCCIEIWKTYD